MYSGNPSKKDTIGTAQSVRPIETMDGLSDTSQFYLKNLIQPPR